MRLENVEARLQGEEKAVSPAPRGHLFGSASVVGRQLVVERDDDGLFAREVAIQEADAHPRLFRDVPECRRFVAANGDQLQCRGIQAFPRGSTLGRWARRPAPLSGLDIFSKHVH